MWNRMGPTGVAALGDVASQLTSPEAWRLVRQILSERDHCCD
jgi:hypothetical protein